jgi:hypothetical protein
MPAASLKRWVSLRTGFVRPQERLLAYRHVGALACPHVHMCTCVGVQVQVHWRGEVVEKGEHNQCFIVRRQNNDRVIEGNPSGVASAVNRKRTWMRSM